MPEATEKPPRKLRGTLVVKLRIASLVTVLATAAALWIIGKVPNRQWNPTQETSIRRFQTPDGRSEYSICTVELDDQGVLWDPRQLDWTLEHLESVISASENGAILFVFVHGWKQDAAWHGGTKGRLALFRQDLERIADRAASEPDEPEPAPVAGVYLGWRGRSFSIPLLENLTFWNRRVAATRAASIDMLEVLLKIAAITRQDEQTKLVLMGHSLGGAIVERVLAPALVTAALSQPIGQRPVSVDYDLVVLANPARSALNADRLIRFFERNQARLVIVEEDGTVVPAGGPLIASINSDADMVNRLSYPLGMWVNSLFLRYRTDHTPDEPSQRRLGIRAAGHEQTLVSHEAWVTEDGNVDLRVLPDATDGSPYWVIRVPREISSGHSDVTGNLWGRLMIDLMERDRVFDLDASLALSTKRAEE